MQVAAQQVVLACVTTATTGSHAVVCALADPRPYVRFVLLGFMFISLYFIRFD